MENIPAAVNRRIVPAPRVQATGRAAIPESQLTQDLWLGSDAPASTPAPVGTATLEGIKARAQKLPEGAPKDLAGYELLAVLGRGAMGSIFLAKRMRNGLPVALKVPHDQLLDNTVCAKRI